MSQVDSDSSIGICLAQAAVELQAVSDSPRLDAEVLLVKAMVKTRTYFYTWPEKRLTLDELQLFQAMLQRRRQGEPIAYIVGEKEFWSHLFYVDSSTLIPRGDSELLVELALTLLDHKKDAYVLDLGTGTGALALSIAKECPDAFVHAIDASESAIALATKNKARLDTNNCSLYVSDWFSAVDTSVVFDVIVSNPPYIDAQDSHLSEGDVRFEPLTALVADNNGLRDIERIAQTAPQYLTSGGSLLIEHGWQQATEVAAIFRRNGFLDIETIKDLNGNDRVTKGVNIKRG